MKSAGYGLAAICVAAILLIGLGIRELRRQPDGSLHLRFLNVGQGDSALIATPEGKTVIIDGGPDWSTLESIGKFLPFFTRRIDLLVLSHPNLDHLVSFPEILKRYSVGAIALSGIDHALPRTREIFMLAAEKNVRILTLSAGQTIDLDSGVRMDVLWPPKSRAKGFTKEVNDTSVVLMLRYKNRTALFTGDIERAAEETLVRAHAPLKADILKVAHHGSRTSSSTGFLLAVRPDLAVISVGENTYGHPRPEIVRRLQDAGSRVWRTDREGTLEVIW